MLILPYPKRQSIALSTTLFRLYNTAMESDDDEIVFDLTRSKSLTPFGVILLTSTIIESFAKSKKCKYRAPKDTKLRNFLVQIGFNNFFKLEGQLPEKDLIQTSRVQLRRCTGLDYYMVEKITELFDHHLRLSRGVYGSLRMSIIETMTNVVDHSEKNDYFVCAYSYPQYRKIRLCIADLGCGVLKSLKSSPRYSELSDPYDAIRLATNSGVSSRRERAGLGLNHIKDFIKANEGQLCIISGKGKVFWKYDHGKIMNQKMKLPFNGTIVKLIINIDKEGYYMFRDEKDYIV